MSEIVCSLKDAGDVAKFGGKAASLARMIQAGFPVPDGFVISSDAYQRFNPKIPQALKTEILAAFDKLGAKRVAVRSSAIAEDSTKASWAGQLETVLNATRNNLIEAIEYCWASMQSERAQTYAKENDIAVGQQAVAVAVQTMVDSDAAGVMFTANPVTNSKDECVIEAIFGLGELLVQGSVTPESYTLNKNTGEVIMHSEHRQTKKLIYQADKNQEVPIRKVGRILTPKHLEELLKTGKKIQEYYGQPQDIEFAFAENKLYIVQSRPITTLDQVATNLPEFFRHCVKTIARPATLQRDEIVRYTANKVWQVEVVTIPLEGVNRAYYMEAENAKKLLGKCLASVDTEQKLNQHLQDYQALKREARAVKEFIEADPKNYQEIFERYFRFLDHLSPFLYVGVAVDKILYPKLKKLAEEKYPANSDEILEIIATPTALHDYQKQRLAICELLPIYKKDAIAAEGKIIDLARDFAHVNEYSFVEPLISPEEIKAELDDMTIKAANAEAHDIKSAVEQNKTYDKRLEELLHDETILTQALLVKEYALLRTDRIDRLKLVQTALRLSFQELAKEFAKHDAKQWTVAHVANLLDGEISNYINEGSVPDFSLAEARLDQEYLYFYTKNKVTVITDPDVVSMAQSIIVKPEEGQGESLISPGTTAYPGVATGRVVKISGKDDLKKVEAGDIMVARVTMPDYTAVMKQAAGFITAEGGITSHAAIVARELGKPCVVGSDNCMQVLQEGDVITFNATSQMVQRVEKADYYLGEPDDLFYWGPSRARALYMSDFIEAVEQFFAALNQDEALPNPPKTIVLFCKNQVVWLINANAFADFTKQLFIAYQKQNSLEEDIKNWQTSVKSADSLVKTWGHTLFAEFSLYGAESVLSEKLQRFDAKTRHAIWNTFTLPEKATFLSRIDDELLASQDPEGLAVKYPWIQDGYDGWGNNARIYFKERLEILRQHPKKDPQAKPGNIKLKDDETKALGITRKLAEFMDERKAWMMQTRRTIKDEKVKFEHGWLFNQGFSTPISAETADELWQRYIDFKTSTSNLKGLVASSGGQEFVSGIAKLVGSPSDNVPDDRILIVPSTSPSYVPLMRKARALVTDHGGMMSHAAIVAREFGLPCIVGTKQATKLLKDGDKVVLDLVKGEVNL